MEDKNTWAEKQSLLTAFVLGEATPEDAERLETEMKENESLRAEVDAIRKMMEILDDPQTKNTLWLEESDEKSMQSVRQWMAKNQASAQKAQTRPRKWRMVALTSTALALMAVTAAIFFTNTLVQQIAFHPDGKDPTSMEERLIRPTETEYKACDPAPMVVDTKKEDAMEAPPDGDVNVEKNSVAALPNEEDAEYEMTLEEPQSAEMMFEEPQSTEMMDGADSRSLNSPVVMSSQAGEAPAPQRPRKAATPRSFANDQFYLMDEIIPAPGPDPAPSPDPAPNRNSYSSFEEQTFQNPLEAPYSTFGVDVDTASYTQMRHFLTMNGHLPPKNSVRVEEYINYFSYDLAQPEAESDCPFQTSVEIQRHPWQEGLFMAKISLKGREILIEKRPKLNLVFLLDVSGSMSDWNKLPLVKDGMMKLLDNLNPEDRVSIVTYANGANILLEPVSGSEKQQIEKVILSLNANGSTAGTAGLQKAYALARQNFDPEAVNRIVLCTDGDFNLGMTNNSELKTLIETEAKSGVFLTVLGFGMGNYKDDRMKTLASHGNGVYGFVDSRTEAQKMLCDQLLGTMVTIAKDVKLQVEFNPAHVAAYRLIGYETRKLQDQDFHDDRKDAGDIGAGHCVTALYELVPVGVDVPAATRVDEPRYATPKPAAEEKADADTNADADAKTNPEAQPSPEWFFVKLRWKEPNAKVSSLKTFPVVFEPEKLSETPMTPNFRLASGAALFAMLLRDSAYCGTADFDTVLTLIQPAIGESEQRQEFQKLVEKAKSLWR